MTKAAEPLRVSQYPTILLNVGTPSTHSSSLEKKPPTQDAFHGKANHVPTLEKNPPTQDAFHGQANHVPTLEKKPPTQETFHGQANHVPSLEKNPPTQETFHGQANHDPLLKRTLPRKMLSTAKQTMYPLLVPTSRAARSTHATVLGTSLAMGSSSDAATTSAVQWKIRETPGEQIRLVTRGGKRRKPAISHAQS